MMNENTTLGVNQLSDATAARKIQNPLGDNGKNKNILVDTNSSDSKSAVPHLDGKSASASTAADTDDGALIRSTVNKIICDRNLESDDIGNRVRVGGNFVYLRIDRDCWHPLLSMMQKTSMKPHASTKSPEEPVAIFVGKIHGNISSDICTKKGIPFKVK